MWKYLAIIEADVVDVDVDVDVDVCSNIKIMMVILSQCRKASSHLNICYY